MGRRLQRIDQALTRLQTLQTAELIRRNDDDGRTTVDAHMLRAMTLSTPHHLAELSLRVLQSPSLDR